MLARGAAPEARATREAAPVRVWVMGGGRFVRFAEWPPPRALHGGPWPLRLASRGRLLEEHDEPDESLEAAAAVASCTAYTYDPRDPTPARGGPSFNPRNCGRREQAPIERRDDVLVFSSAPLAAPVVLAGEVRAQLRVRSSCDHTDWVCRLCDVDAAGRSHNICEGMVRVSEAGSGGGAPMRVSVSLGSTACRLRAGHRVRLHVCSAAHPRWMRNLGTGLTGLALATSTESTSARQEVFHDDSSASAGGGAAAATSVLYLPSVREADLVDC